ncbi:MAG: cation-translocating P-type ATPase, partial [Coriobacteriales bacterium]|nr:cation-translocating P-type ATPase [Coriobacteriales bacterium]
MARQRFDVTGMTCAACSARVEKATAEVAGVQKVAVNLLKNSMDVEYDGEAATIDAIRSSVDKAGYGAIPREQGAGAAQTTGATGPSPAKAVNVAAQEAHKVRVRLIVSFIFAIPLFYLDMGHMWGWPLPACFHGAQNAMTLGLTQLLLVVPIVVVNFKFFRNGFKGLVHGAPNMDTLVALGATAS